MGLIIQTKVILHKFESKRLKVRLFLKVKALSDVDDFCTGSENIITGNYSHLHSNWWDLLRKSDLLRIIKILRIIKNIKNIKNY